MEKAPKPSRLSFEEFEQLSEMGQRFAVLSAVYDMHDSVVDIQNEATELMSPDKMMEMASGFLGMG